MSSIAPFKFIIAPDVDGDRAYNILTHSTRVGVTRIVNGTSLHLLLNCVHAMLAGSLSKPGSFNSPDVVDSKGSEPGKLSSSVKYFKLL